MSLFQRIFFNALKKIGLIAVAFLGLWGSVSTQAWAQNKEVFLNPPLNVAPKTLAAQRLDAATFPSEAELYCGTDRCVLGLTRGLVIGSDLAGMLYAPIRQNFDPTAVSGSLYVIDVFGGFQILQTEDNNTFMNAALGYRRIALSNSDNDLAAQGITAQVNYTQRITPRYTQGLRFEGFFVMDGTSLNNTSDLAPNAAGHDNLNDDADYFYHVTKDYPNLRVGFPATVEVFNWGSAQTSLEMPLRIYGQVEPFFIQNALDITGNNISYKETEQNFGARLAGVIAYESKTAVRSAGRYGLKGSLGLDMASHSSQVESAGGAELNLSKRSTVAPYIQLSGSWQF